MPTIFDEPKGREWWTCPFCKRIGEWLGKLDGKNVCDDCLKRKVEASKEAHAVAQTCAMRGWHTLAKLSGGASASEVFLECACGVVGAYHFTAVEYRALNDGKQHRWTLTAGKVEVLD